MSEPLFCLGGERSFAVRRVQRQVLGERVTVLQLGSAQPGVVPMVGIHGLGSCGHDLLEVAGLTGAPTLLVDLPGFGASEVPERSYSVRRAVDALLALLDEEEIDEAVWLGCSYGGHVALRAGLDAPGRVAGLVLVSSGGLDPEPPVVAAQTFTEEVLRARTSAQVRGGTAALRSVTNAATDAFVERRVADHERGGPDYLAIARSVAGVLADDAGAQLASVTAPVELIHGVRDRLVPLSLAQAAAARLPSCRLTTLDAVGHLPWLEAPQAVAAAARRLTASAFTPKETYA